MWSEESKNKIRGEKNHSWKGDKVGRIALHEWIRNRKPKPIFCEKCNLKYALDLANISQKYKRELSDWNWLCRRCHMVEDGRIKNLKQPYHHRHIPWNKNKKGIHFSPSTEFKKGMESWNKGKEHTAIKGDRNPGWKGGISFDKKKYQKEWYAKNKPMSVRDKQL